MRGENKDDVIAEGDESIDGKFGRAFKSDGKAEYVEIPNNDSLNPTRENTVELWVYVEEKRFWTKV